MKHKTVIRQLRSKGFKVLRFWNNEILENIEGVLRKIESALAHPTLSLPFEEARGGNIASLSKNR